MPTQPTASLKCMGCGAPIHVGFFCPKCEARTMAGPGAESQAGSRFTGRAGAKKKKEVLKDDVGRLLKRLAVLIVVVGGGWLAWAQFGDDIMARWNRAKAFTEQERYDPTKDAQVVEATDGQPTEAVRRKTFGVEKVNVEGQ